MADIDNLYYAFWKARKGKDGIPEVEKFRNNLDKNLFSLQKQILSGSVSTGNYYYFTIYDPKERQICAAPFSQRVLHKRYIKLDVRKYFPSISHEIVKEQTNRLFKEKKLLNIFSDIIDSYENSSGHGLPIGNLTSQYLANHFLTPADHFIKKNVRLPAYVRYMDDMILWHNDKSALQDAGKQFVQFIAENLSLEIKPHNVNNCSDGVSFLGYVLYPRKIELSHRSRFRFIKKLKMYENLLNSGEWNQYQYQNHVYPLTAFTEYADSMAFRKNVIAGIGQQS